MALIVAVVPREKRLSALQLFCGPLLEHLQSLVNVTTDTLIIAQITSKFFFSKKSIE